MKQLCILSAIFVVGSMFDTNATTRDLSKAYEIVKKAHNDSSDATAAKFKQATDDIKNCKTNTFLEIKYDLPYWYKPDLESIADFLDAILDAASNHIPNLQKYEFYDYFHSIPDLLKAIDRCQEVAVELETRITESLSNLLTKQYENLLIGDSLSINETMFKDICEAVLNSKLRESFKNSEAADLYYAIEQIDKSTYEQRQAYSGPEDNFVTQRTVNELKETINQQAENINKLNETINYQAEEIKNLTTMLQNMQEQVNQLNQVRQDFDAHSHINYGSVESQDSSDINQSYDESEDPKIVPDDKEFPDLDESEEPKIIPANTKFKDLDESEELKIIPSNTKFKDLDVLIAPKIEPYAIEFKDLDDDFHIKHESGKSLDISKIKQKLAESEEPELTVSKIKQMFD